MPDKLADTQWVDIVTTPPPQSDILLWWLFGIAIVFVIIIGLLIWYRRPRQQLHQLVNKLTLQTATTHDYKQLLAQLERGLCRYLQLPYLSPATALPVDWHIFIKQMKQCRYQRQQPTLEQTQLLLQQVMSLPLVTDKTYVG
jgi:hypothetical protein